MYTIIDHLKANELDVYEHSGLLEACKFFINKHSLKQPSRREFLTAYRACLSHYLYYFEGIKMVDIGKMLGRDHSTIVYSLRSHSHRMQYDAKYRRMTEPLRNELDYYIKNYK